MLDAAFLESKYQLKWWITLRPVMTHCPNCISNVYRIWFIKFTDCLQLLHKSIYPCDSTYHGVFPQKKMAAAVDQKRIYIPDPQKIYWQKKAMSKNHSPCFLSDRGRQIDFDSLTRFLQAAKHFVGRWDPSQLQEVISWGTSRGSRNLLLGSHWLKTPYR